MNRAERRRQQRGMRMVAPDGKVVKAKRARPSPGSALPGPAKQPEPNPERDRRLRVVLASIPEHLRQSDEAKLLLSRIRSTYDLTPATEHQKQAWAAEWAAYLASQPEAVMARAQQAGIVLPGVPQAPHGGRLWTP